MSTFAIFDSFSCRHCYYSRKNYLKIGAKEIDQKLSLSSVRIVNRTKGEYDPFHWHKAECCEAKENTSITKGFECKKIQ